MILAIVLGETCEDALRAIGVLAAVTVELVLSSGVLYAVSVVTTPQVDVYPLMETQ